MQSQCHCSITVHNRKWHSNDGIWNAEATKDCQSMIVVSNSFRSEWIKWHLNHNLYSFLSLSFASNAHWVFLFWFLSISGRKISISTDEQFTVHTHTLIRNIVVDLYALSFYFSFFSKCETLGKDINMLSHHSYDLMQSSMIGIYSFPWHFVCLGRKCWAKRVTFIRFFKLKQVLGKKWYHQRVCSICLTL